MLGSVGVVLLAAAASAMPCENLKSVPLSQATITAQLAPAGPFAQPGSGGRGAAPEGRACTRARATSRTRSTGPAWRRRNYEFGIMN
jgi:hypothetical protein